MIVGYGEIGKSVHKLYENQLKSDYTVITKDSADIIEIDNVRYTGQSATDIMKAYPIDIMHICFTYGEDFSKYALKYIRKHQPDLVIIHSTLAIGTTQELYDSLGGEYDIVHSPVMGKHPHLAESMKTFRKMIGPISPEAGEIAKTHMEKLGVKCEIFDSSRESEAAKLFSTTYYGWNIMFMKDVWKECKMLDINFDQVYTEANKIYNEGYTKFGDTQYVRPVLEYMGKGISGHCIWENSRILKYDDILPDQSNKIFYEGKPEEDD